jgi:hypothetical protein
MSDWRRSVRFIDQYDWDHQATPPALYGVWDNVRSEWIARGLTGPEAGLQAATLCLRFAGLAERSEREARWLDPAVHVELTVSPSRTEVALLRMWVREDDGWYGYVSYLERPPLDPGRWAYSSVLRPMPEAEIESFTRQHAARRSAAR